MIDHGEKIEVQIECLGNNLGIRIPNSLASKMKLKDDSKVYLQVKDGKLIIEPKQDLSLEEMVDQISEENKQNLTDFGSSVGRELD